MTHHVLRTPRGSVSTPINDTGSPPASPRTPSREASFPLGSFSTPISERSPPVWSTCIPICERGVLLATSFPPVSEQNPEGELMPPMYEKSNPFGSSCPPINSTRPLCDLISSQLASSGHPIDEHHLPLESTNIYSTEPRTALESSCAPISEQSYSLGSSSPPIIESNAPVSTSCHPIIEESPALGSFCIPINDQNAPLGFSSSPTISEQSSPVNSSCPHNDDQSPALGSPCPPIAEPIPTFKSTCDLIPEASLPLKSLRTPCSETNAILAVTSTPVSDQSQLLDSASAKTSETSPLVEPHHTPTSDPSLRGKDGAPGVLERCDNIVKSPQDKGEYRGLVLANHLKVLLVSDPETDKSAAALDVKVGSMCDPDEVPGLAHFCEHMLFMGTKKYPEENTFQKFISENGGFSNAYTRADRTQYYFDVLPQHLEAALDIFAQFFISPLFTESATERELNAVNSEHEQNFASDWCRLFQLDKITSCPRHPFHKFFAGNRETLETTPKTKGIDVREELLKFHQQWYSSNIMALAVMGKESLDELESMVVSLFSGVEDKSVVAPFWPEHPFSPEFCRQMTYYTPVSDVRWLLLDFPVFDVWKLYKSTPIFYVTPLLGDQGPGSLHFLLKQRGWCNSLNASTMKLFHGFGAYSIFMDLTEEGMEHIDDIITLVFQFIALLKAEGPQKKVWEEMKELLDLQFRFQDAQKACDLVTENVHILHDVPMEDTLTYCSVVSEWKPELVTEFLSSLTPDNVRVALIAKCFEEKCTMTEPWYGAKYLQEAFDENKVKEWSTVQPNEEMHLPPPNEFKPSRLTLEEEADSTTGVLAPAIIKDTPFMRLWFKKDDVFLLPKAAIIFDFVSPLAYLDPHNCNLNTVWADLVADGLKQFASATELAGLEWNVTDQNYGIQVRIDGYDDKQHVLLERIIDHIVNFTADPKRFYIMKENLIRYFKNENTRQPHELANDQRMLCLEAVMWSKTQFLDVAPVMTPEMLNAYVHKVLRKVHVESFMYGNLTRERALRIANMVESKLPKDAIPLLPEELLLDREIEIDEGAWYLREIENGIHSSSCAYVYYACGVSEPRNNVILDLLHQTLSERCFDVLRTKEQLGYVVSCDIRRSVISQGLCIKVQGEKHPDALEERIEAFITSSLEFLENKQLEESKEEEDQNAILKEEEFLKHRTSLTEKKLEKLKTMSSRASNMWWHISSQVYNFSCEEEVKHLGTVTQKELIQFFKKHISADSPHRRKLSVHVISTAEGGAGHDNVEKDGDGKTGAKEKEEEIVGGIGNAETPEEAEKLAGATVNPGESAEKSVEDAKKLMQATDKTVENADKLAEHAENLLEGAEKLVEATDKVVENGEKLVNATDKPKEDVERLVYATDNPAEDAEKLAEHAKNLVEGAEKLIEATDEAIENAEKPVNATDNPVEGAEKQVEATNKPVEKLVNTTDNPEDAEKQAEQAEHLVEGAERLVEATNKPIENSRLEAEKERNVGELQKTVIGDKHVEKGVDSGVEEDDTKPAEKGADNSTEVINKKPIKITDLVQFKSGRRLYPIPEPMANLPRKGYLYKLPSSTSYSS